MVMAVQAAETHGKRYRRLPEDYPPQIRELIVDGMATSAADFWQALSIQRQLRRRVGRLLQKDTAFITLAATTFAPLPDTTGNPTFNSPWSFVGTPVVSVPAGWSDDGLPLAVQLTTHHEQEGFALALAHRAESAFALPHRLPPVPG
jgi:Asp-tRNA(Asn)/Glu-tRNA(Gln) amidotransferase A subunit family amidase